MIRRDYHVTVFIVLDSKILGKRVVLKVICKAIKENLSLILLLLVLMVGSADLMLDGNPQISSLGSNLLAGFIASTLTIYGIDILIKRRNEKMKIPVMASSYEDVRLMIHWALDLWKMAYVESVGDSQPKSWRELFSKQYITKIMEELDATKSANVLPAIPWSNYIDSTMKKIHDLAEKILDRHAGSLDPKIYKSVHSIAYHYGTFQIQQLNVIDTAKNIPRPHNLGSVMPLINEWFDTVIILHDWTVATHSYLISQKVDGIYGPYLFSNLTTQEHPQARLEPAEFATQQQIFKNWQQKDTPKKLN